VRGGNSADGVLGGEGSRMMGRFASGQKKKAREKLARQKAARIERQGEKSNLAGVSSLTEGRGDLKRGKNAFGRKMERKKEGVRKVL